MNMQRVSPKVKYLWLIKNGFVLLVLTAAEVAGLVACREEEGFLPVAVTSGVLWLVLAVLLLLWPGLRYRRYTYGYDDKRLCLRQGVIFHNQVVAPVCQIQDLHLVEGPLMRLLGLGSVTVSTAGSSFQVTGLSKETAHRLVEELESRLRARVEENGHEEI